MNHPFPDAVTHGCGLTITAYDALSCAGHHHTEPQQFVNTFSDVEGKALNQTFRVCMCVHRSRA